MMDFINPYNFIPFEGTCERHKVELPREKLTGYMECTLRPLTPLFIPNTSSNRALPAQKAKRGVEETSYDFFSYEDLKGGVSPDPVAPVIPGSEIRGAIRSVYEAAYNGCMSSVDLKRLLARRIGVPKLPGLLRKEQEGWKIQPCRRYMLNTTKPSEAERWGKYAENYSSWEEGKTLYILCKGPYKKGNYSTSYFLIEDFSESEQQGTDWKRGYLHRGEPFGDRKHHESVFVPDNQRASFLVDGGSVKALEKVIRAYQSNDRKNQSAPQPYSQYRIDESGTLVYYRRVENSAMVQMAPACISKEVFQASIQDILNNQGEYQSCDDRNFVCPACALFGMIPKGKDGEGQGRASRVRFEDAVLQGPFHGKPSALFFDPITLPPVGEPRPSAVEFYTERPGGKTQYWTYDYKVEDARAHKRLKLEPGELKLHGRKFYWHYWDAGKNECKNWKEAAGPNGSTNQNMEQKIRPLRTHVNGEPATPIIFSFRVYFDGVSREELGRLRWALALWDEKYAHKLGRAKPLGYGSVRIEVRKTYLRQVDQTTGIWKCQESPETLGAASFGPPENKAVEALRTMLNWADKPQGKVAYPKIPDKTKYSYEWFQQNQKPAMAPQFCKILPKPTEERSSNGHQR